MLRRALGCIENKKVGNHNDYQPFLVAGRGYDPRTSGL